MTHATRVRSHVARRRAQRTFIGLLICMASGCRPTQPSNNIPQQEREDLAEKHFEAFRERERQERQYRTWLYRKGSFEIRARFIDLTGGIVTMDRYKDKQVFHLPLEEFSESDQEVLKGLAAAKGK